MQAKIAGMRSRNLFGGNHKTSNMNFDNISSAMMMAFDALKDDPKSKKLIKKIDTAVSDSQLKAGIKQAVIRLRELDKGTIADEIEKKIAGW